MWENEFLDEGTQEDLPREYMGTRLGRQELEGEMLSDLEGALISRDDLDKYRILREEIPELSRVVVAVDPALKAREDHDESGIMAPADTASRRRSAGSPSHPLTSTVSHVTGAW